MSKMDKYILRGKIIITFSILLIIISGGILVYLYQEDNIYDITYQNINVKDMAVANVGNKKEVEKSGISGIIDNYQKQVNSEVPQAVDLPVISKNIVNEDKVWYLPCEMGAISGGINYSHYALDIVSPRGEAEAVYPVANGVISSIYTDYAGALIVTVNHNIDGNLYTSQYVHLSRYESGIYVGKEVTINDKLGYMGSTGVAYGTHLHLALLDCNSFTNDNRCSDLGSFFSYGRMRYTQGFYGLQSVMNVPLSWNNR
ncbi:MAG: M23 family metallopeptidase [Bacilli bacterium]|nr:M23 family metallopeptidase [Bacilli bacterium]